MMYMISFHTTSSDPARREAFEAAVKGLGNWSNRMPGVWMLESKSSARMIRDFLAQKVGAQDRLFVARITRNWAGRNMGDGFPDWMKRRDFGDVPGETGGAA